MNTLLRKMAKDLTEHEYYLLVIMFHSAINYAEKHEAEFKEFFGTNGLDAIKEIARRKN